MKKGEWLSILTIITFIVASFLSVVKAVNNVSAVHNDDSLLWISLIALCSSCLLFMERLEKYGVW